MAGSFKLLDCLVNVTRGERFRINKVDHQIRSCLAIDARVLIGKDAISHISPMRGNTTNCCSQHAGQVLKDARSMTASKFDV